VASFGQQGGQTAGTIINNTPPERHLTPSQTAILDAVVSSLPDSIAPFITVETVNDPEAITFATEIRQVFVGRHKTSEAPGLHVTIRLTERPPIPKGLYVLTRDQNDINIESAQKLANALSGVTDQFNFMGAAYLKEKEIHVLVGYR
jgi:hypothetical protein